MRLGPSWVPMRHIPPLRPQQMLEKKAVLCMLKLNMHGNKKLLEAER